MNQPTARLRKPQAKADYSYAVTADGIVVITDLDLGGMSVTNDICSVLADIAAQECMPSLAGHHIIYRDSMQQWDEVQLGADGTFKRFYSLGGKSEKEALHRLRQRGQ